MKRIKLITLCMIHRHQEMPVQFGFGKLITKVEVSEIN